MLDPHTVESNKVSIKEVEEGSVVIVEDLAQLVVNQGFSPNERKPRYRLSSWS